MYKNIIIILVFLFGASTIIAQEQKNEQQNNFKLGGYGEFSFSNSLSEQQISELDVSRFVLTGDYSFSSKTRLFSEIEFEHVKEVYVEQLWVQHQLHKNINFRTGLLLIPVGIINEYHEPNTFNGVHRPLIDKYLIPTTWREIGAGFSGNFPALYTNYQIYIINGFNGYDGQGHLNAQYPLRKGRQKGAESFMSSPNFIGAISFYGLPKTKIGFSYYTGKSESNLLGNASTEKLDSSRVGMNLLSFNLVTNFKAINIKFQAYAAQFSNTQAYNIFVSNQADNLLAKQVYGFYSEFSYNLLYNKENTTSSLNLFIRYEQLNNQFKMENDVSPNKEYRQNAIISGFSWKPQNKVAFKADIQNTINELNNKWETYLNLGVGFSF